MSKNDNNKNKNKIELYLDLNKFITLEKIIKELYTSKSIETESIEEFLKLTIFIVFDEYKKNKHSLNEFYRQNMEVYKQNNKDV
jgi:hypothetical protein